MDAGFWAKISPEPNSGCWLWDGAWNSEGYGQIRRNGRALYAHRVAYECLVGPIPPKFDLDHKCRTRCCCNPDHLEPVTRTENSRRGLKGVLLPPTCPNGHPRTPENRYTWGRCKPCHRGRNRGRSREVPIAA